jgi:hypothetical protein
MRFADVVKYFCLDFLAAFAHLRASRVTSLFELCNLVSIIGITQKYKFVSQFYKMRLIFLLSVAHSLIDERIRLLMCDTESMVWRFTLAYYYATPQDTERIAAFRKLSGDSEKSLITQFVRGWIGRNRDYYLGLARNDAIARDMSFRDWGETIVTKGVEALPPYQQEIKDISPNPLREIVLTPDAIRNPINYISLGTQNMAFLRVAILYDRDSSINFVSRIVREHLSRNWDKLYAPQVEAENFENWK